MIRCCGVALCRVLGPAAAAAEAAGGTAAAAEAGACAVGGERKLLILLFEKLFGKPGAAASARAFSLEVPFRKWRMVAESFEELKCETGLLCTGADRRAVCL